MARAASNVDAVGGSVVSSSSRMGLLEHVSGIHADRTESCLPEVDSGGGDGSCDVGGVSAAEWRGLVVLVLSSSSLVFRGLVCVSRWLASGGGVRRSAKRFLLCRRVGVDSMFELVREAVSSRGRVLLLLAVDCEGGEDEAAVVSVCDNRGKSHGRSDTPPVSTSGSCSPAPLLREVDKEELIAVSLSVAAAAGERVVDVYV